MKNETTVGGVFLITHVEYQQDTKKYTSPRKDTEEIPATLISRLSNDQPGLSKELLIFPDSGANICLAGTDHLSLIDLSYRDLIPSNNRICAVEGSILSCIG